MPLRCIEPFRRRATRAHLGEGRVSTPSRPFTTVLVKDSFGQGRPAFFASTLKVQRSAVGSGSGRARDACGQSRSWVELTGSTAYSRTTGSGASRPLPSVHAKVP